jgi:hypothetical protein
MELAVQQRCGQLAGGVVLHEALPLICLLEHPSWRLANLLEAAGASEQRGRAEAQ